MLYLDTSVLVPLFVPEPESPGLRQWFESQHAAEMLVSEWALTEFASALGMKVRDKALRAEQASEACLLMRRLAVHSYRLQVPSRADFQLASEFMAQFNLGLRAGDALHLAIARNEGASRVVTFDRALIRAAGKLKIKAAAPL